MRRIVLATTMAFAAAALAAAQTQVDERRPAKPDGVVQIAVPAGSFNVVGWEKAEVAIRGTLEKDAQGIDIDGGKESVRIKVKGSPNARGDLEINVPSGSRLNIETFSGGVTVKKVTGRVAVEGVSGNVTIHGAEDVSVESISGTVEINGARKIDVEAVNGPVNIARSGGEIRASTVDGALTVVGDGFENVKLGTISGNLRFDGDLTKAARLAAKTVSGVVTLVLPTSVDASFNVRSISGAVENELGPQPGQRDVTLPGKGPHHGQHKVILPGKDLHFSIGEGNAQISVETMSGPVHLKKK